MSLSCYPTYKDAGTSWLGKVPSHWTVRCLGFYFDERSEKVSDTEFAALSVTKKGIVPQLETAAKTDDNDNRKKVCIGDFVINSRSDRKGSSGLSDLDGSVSLINTVLTPCEEVVGRYIHHLLRSELFQEEFYRNGKGIVADLWSTNYSEMRNIVIAIPPKGEQTAIASFLDRETAKIDALLAEQEKLMALLKEKRRAVISHTVIKGLSPDVPMKDSGIEWVGEVPAHWEVGPLQRFWSVKDCKHLTAEFVEDGFPLASIREVRSRNVQLENARRTTQFFYEQLIEGGRKPQPRDLIFSRNATVGEVAQVPDTTERFAMGQDVCLLRRLAKASSADYMQLVLRSPATTCQLATLMIGSTFKRVNVEEIRNLRVPFPPAVEQAEIVASLLPEVEMFDRLIEDGFRAVELIRERRTVLISAAVTGQIDVRSAA